MLDCTVSCVVHCAFLKLLLNQTVSSQTSKSLSKHIIVGVGGQINRSGVGAVGFCILTFNLTVFGENRIVIKFLMLWQIFHMQVHAWILVDLIWHWFLSLEYSGGVDSLVLSLKIYKPLASYSCFRDKRSKK